MQRGACLCGEVAFVVEAEVHDPIACHCRECRRQSGHYFAAVPAPKAAVRMTEEAGLTWYRASDKAARGFCRTCGSTLFWRADEGAMVMVAMGALEAPTGMRLSGHYWVDEKGSYYEITDGLPQHKGGEA